MVLLSVLGQLGRDFGELSGGERDGVRVVDRVDQVVCLVHDHHRAAQREAERFPCPRMEQRCIRQQHQLRVWERISGGIVGAAALAPPEGAELLHVTGRQQRAVRHRLARLLVRRIPWTM